MRRLAPVSLSRRRKRTFDGRVEEKTVVDAFHPTEPQVQGWPLIRAGQDVLISAPTGSGKTLAAFTRAWTT
jgi:Lhr-like helicase